MTAAVELGATLGVEEEYHLVDPETFGLLSRPALSAEAMTGTVHPRLRAEMLSSQLEAVTDVCTDLEGVRREIVAMRREAANAAADHGATILATSTHPTARMDETYLTARDRYERLVTRFGSLVRVMNLCGCHVHVSVPDIELAVAIMTRARAYLPLLNALTGSSPFHESVDTGYASFRTAWMPLWPQGGLPPHLSSGEEYFAALAQLQSIGVVSEPSEVLWELRPSSKYPTLEFRIGDVCTDVDDSVLFAGIIRSLVRTLGARATAGTPAPVVVDPFLRGMRWRAARYGLTEQLWSPSQERLVPASVAVADLLAELRPDLEAHGEADVVQELADGLLARRTSADRQRATYGASGDLRKVISEAVAQTLPD